MDQVLHFVSRLMEEVLVGSTQGLAALLMLVIIVLVYEVRTQRKNVKEAYKTLEDNRVEFLKVIDTMQTRFSEKSDELLTKYHSALSSQNENNDRMRFMLDNILNFINRSSK